MRCARLRTGSLLVARAIAENSIAAHKWMESGWRIGGLDIGNQIDSRSRLPSSDESKRAQPTIRCHVDHALLVDISPTFFSPANLFPLPLPLLPSPPPPIRQQYYLQVSIQSERERAKRINSIPPLFSRHLIETISMQMARWIDEEISGRTGSLRYFITQRTSNRQGL